MKLTVEQIKTLESQGMLQDWKRLVLALASQEALDCYNSTIESAESVKDSVYDSASAAHDEYIAPYRVIYDNARKQADSVFNETLNPAWKEYRKAEDSAFQAILDSL